MQASLSPKLSVSEPERCGSEPPDFNAEALRTPRDAKLRTHIALRRLVNFLRLHLRVTPRPQRLCVRAGKSHFYRMDSTETPDIASSTDDYASRFSGRTGEYLLGVQNRAVLQLAQPWKSGTVLDVGGGHAQLCGPLLEAGFAVTVLGSDARCFERPRRFFGERASCIEGDLLQPPFPDRSFDVVVAIRMLAHITDTSRFIAGLCRVARNAVIVDYPDVRSINAVAPLLYGMKKKLEGNTRTYRMYGRRELTGHFTANAFGQPKAVGQFFWPMVLHRKLSRPALSRSLEMVPDALGLTRLFGSPILLRMERL